MSVGRPCLFAGRLKVEGSQMKRLRVTLDNSPTYQARAVLTYPEKQVELTVENFEYQHVGASR